MPSKPPSPTLDWYALQSGLEHAESDVLILLDSCASAGSSGGSKQYEIQEGGTTELISACGFETSAPGPGPHSFTNALIAELRDMARMDTPFAVSILHQRIVSRLVHFSPKYSSGLLPLWSMSQKQGHRERRATPVYISLCRETQAKSIHLVSFKHLYVDSKSASSSNSQSSSKNKITKTLDHSARTATTVKRLLGDDDCPKVLLAINLQGERWSDVDRLFADWLKDIPVPVNSVNIEAVFHSYSTLLLISAPIAVWNCLSKHPSCSFIGVVKSSNLLLLSQSAIRTQREDYVYAKHPWLGTYLLLRKDEDQQCTRILSWRGDLGEMNISLRLRLPFFHRMLGLVRSHGQRMNVLIFLLPRLPLGSFLSWIYYSIRESLILQPNGSPQSTGFTLDANGDAYASTNPRSTSDIVWSCLVTIILCTWTISHLDMSEEYGSIFRRKYFSVGNGIYWAITGLFAPEYILAKAVSAYIDNAVAIHKAITLAHWNSAHWSFTHTMLAKSGAFVVNIPVSNQNGVETAHVTLKALFQMQQLNYIMSIPECNQLPGARTRHGSLARSIVVLQAVWFLIQAGARFLTKLPLAPLELFACICVICFGSTMLIRSHQISDPEHLVKIPLENEKAFLAYLQNNESLILERRTDARNWIRRRDEEIETFTTTYWFALAAAFLISGGILSIAWDFAFPTSTEVLLWRGTVSLSFLFSAAFLLVALAQYFGVRWPIFKQREGLAFSLSTTFAILLVWQRASLIFEVFHSLWVMPTATFQPFDWATVVPHI